MSNSTKPDRPSRGKRERVTLAAPHTHAGKPREEGESIDVFPHQRERLEKAGKVKPRSGGGSSKAAGPDDQQQNNGGNAA